MSKLFESKWQQTKEALLEGLDGQRRNTMGVVLDNTRNAIGAGRSFMAESATPGATSAGNVATLNKVILPVIRRVMPTVIANELIGVQPMVGPVGQIHTLRVRYADTYGSPTPVTAGTEALGPFEMAKFYSGNGDSTNPAAADTSALEGLPGNRIQVQVLRETVEAKTRKLSARWTPEASQDAMAQQGIDLETEITAALAQEITAEIDQTILANLRALPGSPAVTYDQNLVSGTATYVGDEHAALATLIIHRANVIAQRTRRGVGNWVVVSPTALTVLQSASTSAFARTTQGTFAGPTNTKFVGVLNSSMKVYVDQFASDTTPVLVGYKGEGTEVDAAAYYCPYIPLMSSGILTDPNTLEQVVGFTTRYGYLALTNSASSFGNAADYLGLIGMSANVRFL